MENTTPLYNTYGDLYDAPQIVYSIDGNSEEIKETNITRLQELIVLKDYYMEIFQGMKRFNVTLIYLFTLIRCHMA